MHLILKSLKERDTTEFRLSNRPTGPVFDVCLKQQNLSEKMELKHSITSSGKQEGGHKRPYLSHQVGTWCPALHLYSSERRKYSILLAMMHLGGREVGIQTF